MRVKLFSGLLIAIIMLSTFCLGNSVIEVNSLKDQININQVASFNLSIYNNETKPTTYNLYLMQYAQGWNIYTDPIDDKVVKLNPNETRIINVLVKPVQKFDVGIYDIPIFIKANDLVSYEQKLRIVFLPEKPLDYLPSIRSTVDMVDKVNPQEPLSIKLFLENKNPLNLKDLKIRIQSDLPELVNEVLVDLPPLEKKTVEFTLTPNRYQSPGDHIMFIIFERAGEQVKIIEKHFEFISLMPEFTMNDYVGKVFFKHYHSLEVQNGGNVKNTQEVKLPVTFWQYLFESSEGKVKVINDQRYLTWELTLMPGEIVTVEYVYNYRILLYLLLVALAFLTFYLVVRSPLSISKKALTVKSDEKGALSEVKINLEVKNTSSKAIKNIHITDMVPGIATVERVSGDEGTIRPQEILHTAKGTKVVWSISELEGGEHMEITYKIKAKLNILGTFTLPRATGEFSTLKGKKKKAYSNPFSLNG